MVQVPSDAYNPELILCNDFRRVCQSSVVRHKVARNLERDREGGIRHVRYFVRVCRKKKKGGSTE